MSNPCISRHNEPKREKKQSEKERRQKKSISIRQACSHLSEIKFDVKDNVQSIY